MQVPIQTREFRFGAFKVDLRSGELRKHGMKIKLQVQPFQILALLLKRPGEMVSREEMRQELWSSDTTVDFDMGLNSAIKRLRDALGDTAEEPRFIETLPRRGYRFIAQVQLADSAVVRDESPQPPEPERLPPQKPEVVALQQTAESLLPAQTGHLQEEAYLESDDSSGKVEPVFERIEIGGDFSSQLGVVKRHWPWRSVGIIAGLAVLAAVLWWLIPQRRGPYVIAVLPFQNLGSEPDSDYFSDGLTDEIIRNISIIDGLQVKSRASSFAFKDKPINLHVVSAQLGTNLVLEGSVQRSGDKLRINTQLIRVSDDLVLWSGRFDRELKDVFAIEDEISRSIVNELRLKLGSGQRRYNTNLEAYDLYLRAQTQANDIQGRPGSGPQLLKNIELFQEVIAKDPGFAPAYAGIATAYARMSSSPRRFSPDEAYAKMREASEKALQLDPLLAEAYSSMGLVYSRDRAWEQAERTFRRAIQLNPNLSGTHLDFGIFVLFSLGRVDEAVRELRAALELDPLSGGVRDSLGLVLVSAGRYNEVLDISHQALAIVPDDQFAQQLSGRALLQKGKLNEATAVFEGRKGDEGFLGYAYAQAGRRAEAEQIITQHPDWPWIHALVYAGLGDKDRVFEALEKMAAIKDPRVGMYLTYPELALLRGDPRLNEFRQKLTLPLMP